MKINVDPERIAAELRQLATYSDAPAPAVTRVVFTPTDLQARAYVKDIASAAGLQLREDAVGNTFARWAGEEPDAPAVGTGSHIDAIPNAGAYDGTVGVIGGLEAIRALLDSGIRPRRSIELLLFTSEEPTRFGIGCLGSRLLSGSLHASAADDLRGNDGVSLNQARRNAGFAGDLDSVRLAKDYFSAFIELHIEQGPLLERNKTPVGIVTAIAAPASLRFIIEGEGGHAGAVLMPHRHDAFLAAAEIALAVEHAAKSTGSIDTVGTCGVCDVFPGAVNGIPSRVRIDLDIRDIDRTRRDGVLDVIRQTAKDVSLTRGVDIQTELINADDPATCSPEVVSALIDAAQSSNLSYREMVSRAYHDSLFISRVAPTAMLFIPCRNGWSHRPDEFASIPDIANGTMVLARALAALSA
jgi:N-carbamoyl-L-amino-acid hydrolase